MALDHRSAVTKAPKVNLTEYIILFVLTATTGAGVPGRETRA
jgi:hypothetical protein